MVLSPRESGKYIASRAEHVTIKRKKIAELGNILVEKFKSGDLVFEKFKDHYHPRQDNEKAVDWLFIKNTLDFCYSDHKQSKSWRVEYNSGTFALCAAINRAIRENIDILNPEYYSNITDEELQHILRGNTQVKIPLIPEKVKCLHEVGNILLTKYKGSFENVVKEANGSAVKLVELIVKNFVCFKDEAEYKGERVAFYQRAQHLVADIFFCFENKNLGYFKDIDELTLFADYRIPQTLLLFNVFKYTPDLMRTLRENEILSYEDNRIIEIRGCSIHVAELLKEHATKVLGNQQINAILIDHFLWKYRYEHGKEIYDKGIPFHKVITINS